MFVYFVKLFPFVAVVSRCQLLLCSRQIAAVLRAAVCLYAGALDLVTLTRLDAT